MAEKTEKRWRKVSDAPDKKETQRKDYSQKKESDRRWGQTRMTVGVVFRALKEEKGLRADMDVTLLLSGRLFGERCVAITFTLPLGTVEISL